MDFKRKSGGPPRIGTACLYLGGSIWSYLASSCDVPGRKIDICDSKWLAGLLRHGLVKGRFIPPEHVRECRELSRLRKTYTESLADYKQRVHKLFITANFKIDSVVSDLFGLTGLNIIDLLCQNDEVTLEKVQECAKGGLKKKIPELYLSLHGYFGLDHNIGHFVFIFSEPRKYRWNYKRLRVS